MALNLVLRMYHHFATVSNAGNIKYRTHDNPEDIQELADTQAGRQQKLEIFVLCGGEGQVVLRVSCLWI